MRPKRPRSCARSSALPWLLVGACLVSGCEEASASKEAPLARELPAAIHEVGDEPNVYGADQALLGGTRFDDRTVKVQGVKEPGCNEDDKAMFRQFMILGRTVALGGAIRQCVRHILGQGDGTFGPYQTCPSDPFASDKIERQIQGVLSVLTTPNPVLITCTTGNIGVTRVSGRYGLPSVLPEPFDIPNPPLSQLFDASFLSGANRASSATREEADFRARVFLMAPRSALIWHEAMHVHEYRHDCPNQTYFESVPYMVQYCLQQVAQRSVEHCDMRGGCPTGGERALVDSYPITEDTGCECVRDAVAQGSSEIPATPVLDRGEAGDRFGWALASGDFNGDGFADLAVGAPGEDGDAGKVFLYLGSVFGLYAERVIEQTELERAEPGDEFGASLLAFDLDRDQIDDLVIGAPGEDRDTGALYLFRGTRAGLVARSSVGRAQEVTLAPGARFGEALAAGLILDATQPVVAVGAPATAAAARAGAVYLMAGVQDADGLLEPRASLRPSAAEAHAGDRFGAALAFGAPTGTPYTALFVGAPGRAPSGLVHAVLLPPPSVMSAGAVLEPNYVIRPDSGAPDRFGSSLVLGRAAGPETLVVGAPGASVDGRTESGTIHLFRAHAQHAAALQRFFGRAEGEQLGSALLATGRWRVLDEFFAGASRGSRAALYKGESSFDRELMDYRARWGAAPKSAPARAFAHGDFDGSGVLDLAIGAPDEPGPGRAPRGGFFEVFRRLDDGGWASWGRYRQGE